MQSLTDTIVAPITAIGGAVALVRLSGSRSVTIAESISTYKSTGAWNRSRLVVYESGDDGLATPFKDGHSFTGEESVELSCHGSLSSVTALVESCVDAGARQAEPGEFTYRAFMNGRLDLTQAEGVRDTVLAKTDSQLRQANLLRDGFLRAEVQHIYDAVTTVLVAVEASTDFSEEIGDLDRNKAVSDLKQSIHETENLLSTASQARTIREGITVAIVGRPNVGKSSLLNRISHSDRAIVTDIPGTTRDTLDEIVNVQGLAVRFVDTAGLRETNDTVERIGVERSRQIMADAEHVWFVFDASTGWTHEDQVQFEAIQRPSTLVGNKCDLEIAQYPPDTTLVSANTGIGLDTLLNSLVTYLGHSDVALINQRHALLLDETKSRLMEVVQTFSSPVPDDLAAVELRSAIRALGEITGVTADPNVIERVFHDFCIGK